MLEDGEIALLNGPLGEAFISDYLFLFSIWLFLNLDLQAAYLTEVRDPGLDYLDEVERTLNSVATEENVFDAYIFQLGIMALFIIH